jgi:chemotaxis protein MotB
MRQVNSKKLKSKGGYIMKRFLYFAIVLLVVLSVSGCCGKLKQANLKLTSEVTQLQQDKDTCNKALASAQGDIAARDKALAVKAKEIQTKEVQVKQQSAAFAQMQEAMKAELASKEVTLKELEGKLTLTMVEAILFDSGKANVKKEGKEALKKVAGVLKEVKDQDIIIAGYTDDVKISATLAKKYPTNWELSSARAISVVKLLQADGVNPELLSAAGFSEYRPVADNKTAEGRAKNRRMEIILMPKR